MTTDSVRPTADFTEAFRRGEEAAFERLVDECKDRLYFSALKMLRSPEDAEDAVAAAFAAAYKERLKFRGEARAYTWLWRICFNFCWHQMHKKRIPAFSLDELASESGGESALESRLPASARRDMRDDIRRQIEAASARKAVRSAILRLPRKLRRIVILRDLMDYSYEEIAVILDVSRGTVMSRLWRARENLKKILAPRRKVPSAADETSGAPSSAHPRFRLPAAENL